MGLAASNGRLLGEPARWFVIGIAVAHWLVWQYSISVVWFIVSKPWRCETHVFTFGILGSQQLVQFSFNSVELGLDFF